MGKIIHEIMLRDEGLPSERCTLRSSAPQPNTTPGNYPEMMYQESGIPANTSDYLLALMRMHDEALAREIGKQWLTGEE